MTDRDIVLVTAATGRQGGATARALLADPRPERTIRVLVRDPAAPAAQALAAAGAELVVGDLDLPESLRIACRDVRAVFSMQSPTLTATGVDFSKEVGQGKHLVEAARAEGVRTFVHTATTGVGAHRAIEGWAEGRWKAHETYWENKLATCERVRNAGFEGWTILLPATFMDHVMIDPQAFLEGRKLLTVIAPERPLAFIAPEDIGKAAAAAIADPDRWRNVTLELAGDVLTLPEVAAILSRLDGKRYEVKSGTVEQAIADGMHPGLAAGLSFMNVAPLLARPELARAFGLAPIGFETWAKQQRVAS